MRKQVLMFNLSFLAALSSLSLAGCEARVPPTGSSLPATQSVAASQQLSQASTGVRAVNTQNAQPTSVQSANAGRFRAQNSLLAPPAPPAPQAAVPSAIRLYSIGHSLSAEIPDMTAALAGASRDLSYSFQEQFRLGASLQAQWEEAQSPKDKWDDQQFRVSYPKALPKGDFNAVVLIDSVPRGGPEQETQAVEYLTKFVQYIAQTNPKAHIYYAEAWHSLWSGTGKAPWDTASPTRHLAWRARIDADAPMWERIRAKAAQATGQKIVLIPQAQALGRLVDAIEAGQVPGFKVKEDVFADDIHLNPYGMYFLACFHHATLYGRSPAGLPLEIKNRWGVPYWDHPFNGGKSYPKPDPAGMREMQSIAWQLASGQAATGQE